MLDASSLIHVRFIESPLEEVMQTFLQGTGLTYTVDDKTVVIRRKHQSRTDVKGWELSQQLRVSGSVTDTTGAPLPGVSRSEEHTSELQSLMRTSHAVFC